jgi:hypothetical protein
VHSKTYYQKNPIFLGYTNKNISPVIAPVSPINQKRKKPKTQNKMDEILTSTSAELEDLAWLSSAMNKFEHVQVGSGSAVISSSTHHAPWTMADESGDQDFFSEDSSEEPCIKRPRKFIFISYLA